MSLLERCPHFRGCYVQASMELGPEDVSLLERRPHFRGCYVQVSMELGPEDVSLLERCPHFRGCYVQASRPEDGVGCSQSCSWDLSPYFHFHCDMQYRILPPLVFMISSLLYVCFSSKSAAVCVIWNKMLGLFSSPWKLSTTVALMTVGR